MAPADSSDSELPPLAEGGVSAEERLSVLLRNITKKYSKGLGFTADYGFHHSKVNTISKTGDIIRQLNDGQSSLYDDDETYERQRKEAAQKAKRIAKQRLGNLYGAAPISAGRLKGHKVTLHGHEQDFEYEDVDVESVKVKVEACPLLLEEGGSGLEAALTDNVISILDLRYMLRVEYRLALTVKQTAALIGLIDKMVSSHNCVVGKGHNAAVNLQRFLVGLKLLAEELRSIDRSRRRVDAADRRDKNEERIRALEPDREARGPIYLADLLDGLRKISEAAQLTRQAEPRYFHKMCNAYSCLEGSVDGSILKDFCRDNLHCRLTAEEACAVMKHADRLGSGYIAMDYFLRQIKIEGLGKSSIFSPLNYVPATGPKSDKISIIASTNSSTRYNTETTSSVGGSSAAGSIEGKILTFNGSYSKGRGRTNDDDNSSVMSQLSEFSTCSSSKFGRMSNRSPASSVHTRGRAQLAIPIPSSLLGVHRPLKDPIPSMEPQPTFNYNKHVSEITPLDAEHADAHPNPNPSGAGNNINRGSDDKTLLSASKRSASSSATGHVSFYSKPPLEYKVNIKGDLLSTKDSFYNAVNFFKKCTEDDRKGKNELFWASGSDNKSITSSSSRLDKFQRVPTSLGYELRGGGGAMIVRPRDPVGLARPVDAVDADNISHIHAKLDPIISPIKSGRKGKGVDKHRAKEQGGKMIGGMDLDNPVRDLDMKRWLHETFSRLPLSQKGALIRYQKRWPLLGSIVTVMKKLKISVDGVIEKMKSNFINSHRPFLKINDALADIGFWLDRESVVEVLDKEMLVRRTKTAHLFFTSLDPRKKGSVANFELAALLAVLLHLPWASPWSNSDSTCTPVRATQIVDCLLTAAADELQGVIPQVIIDSALLCICTSYQAEDTMIELLSPVLTKMKSGTFVLHSPDPSLKGSLVRVVEKSDVLSALKSSKPLCDHIELQFRLATVAAAALAVE